MRANTRDFTNKMGKVERRLRNLGGFLGSAAKSAAKFGLVMGGIATGALVLWIRNSAQAIDRISKLSQQLGIATKDLGALEYAAELSGVKVESLHKSLQFFNKSVGEAQTGIGEAVYGLEELGITADELAGRPMWDQLTTIAERFENLETQQKKAYVATKLFGRSGSDLIVLLQQGKVTMEEFRKEAERLGLTFTEEEAFKVAAANDALTRLHYVLKGIGRTITIEISPYIEAVANAFTDWATSSGGVGKLVVGAIESITLSLTELIGRLERLRWLAEQVAHPFSLKPGPGPFGGGVQFGTSETWEDIEKRTTNRQIEIMNAFQKIRNDADRAAADAAARMKMPTEQLNAALEKTNQVAKTAADSVFQLLDGIILKGQTAADVLRSVLQSIASMALRQGVNAAFGQIGVATPK